MCVRVPRRFINGSLNYAYDVFRVCDPAPCRRLIVRRKEKGKKILQLFIRCLTFFKSHDSSLENYVGFFFSFLFFRGRSLLLCVSIIALSSLYLCDFFFLALSDPRSQVLSGRAPSPTVGS